MTEGSSAAARLRSLQRMRTPAAFTSGTSSVSTDLDPVGFLLRYPLGHVDPAEATHQARSEAHSDAVAAAGDQAAADVDAGIGRSPEPGGGGEPDARGGPHGGSPAGRGDRAGGEARGGEQGGKGRLLGRRRL